jgi:hypothetical protein
MRISSTQPAIINTESKKALATSRGFAINTTKPFRKTILAVTHLDGIFYENDKTSTH